MNTLAAASVLARDKGVKFRQCLSRQLTGATSLAMRNRERRLVGSRVSVQIAVRKSGNSVRRLVVRASCLGNQSERQEDRTGGRVLGGFGDGQLPTVFLILAGGIYPSADHQGRR